MKLLAILWILLPLLPSLTLVWLLWPRENSFQPPFPLKLILATGLALGFSSIVYLVSLELVGPPRWLYLLGEIALALIPSVLIIWRLIVRAPATDSPFRYPTQTRSLLLYLLWGFFCFVLCLSVVNFALWSVNHPHGGWEALNNWNLRAAFLYRGGEHWKNVFSPLLGSATSPLLLPGAIARIWHYLDHETAWVPTLVAMFFTFGTVGLLVTALFQIRGEMRALLAGLFLLGTMWIIRYGAFQQADVPVAFFLLATWILLHFSGQCSDESGRGLLVLAGLTAGFALWTKDDARWLLLSLLLSRAAVAIAVIGWGAFRREVICLGLGFLPSLLMTMHYKMGVAQSHSWFGGQGLALNFHHLLEPIRYLRIGQSFVESIFSYSSGAMVLLVVLILVCGKVVDESDRTDVATFCVFILLTWGGFCAYALIGPVGTHAGFRGWLHHVMTRLLLQLWPTILFFCFLICNLPRRPNESRLADEELV